MGTTNANVFLHPGKLTAGTQSHGGLLQIFFSFSSAGDFSGSFRRLFSGVCFFLVGAKKHSNHISSNRSSMSP